ncbi:MAG: recombination mediator RecR [Pseudomonadota bacterium]|nr:recombination mediator RecR [Pseudomonadota bacterium]MEC8275266.1 recombination mediator RecR [Pseudomonadota bacterium]MEC8711185.1 recombination mediator RecR [Pseudomonadota bacterium]
MILNDLEPLLRLLGRLPGVGPRSARRLALELIQNKEALMRPLAQSLLDTADAVRECSACGNLDTEDPCRICLSPSRLGGDGKAVLCVVETVSDLWALERSGSFKGRYHVLGGTLSALDGRGPDQLRVGSLLERVRRGEAREVILALSATVDGQTTAHYLAERLRELGAEVSAVAQGVPVGGSLEYLDDGTLLAAMNARRSV